MLRFYAITIAYALLTITSLVFANSIFEGVCLFFTLFLIYSAIVAVGASNIRSMMFVKTHNCFPNTQNKIALTYDDGPDEKQTEKILDILKRYDAKATFFVIGKNAEKNIEILKRMSNEGHSIGNHSYFHENKFPIKSVAQIAEEISRTQSIINSVCKRGNKYFRPPFGVTNPLIAKAIKQTRMLTIGWNIRSLDTCKKSKEDILSKVCKNLKSGDVILLHDKTEHVCWLTEQILIQAQSKNLNSAGIDELMKS